MKMMLGYCCISNINPKLKCSQGSTKTWLEKNTHEVARAKLLDKAKSNLYNLKKLLHENKANKIFAFRLPEQLLPQADLGYYTIYEFANELKEIGAIANKYKMQLSQHPSQYFVLNSTREDVVEKTVSNLNTFADILAMMELDKTPNLTIHVGAKSGYPSKQAACDAFCRGFDKLNDNAKRFLVVENDQNSFSVNDCMYIHSQIGIPVVLDNAHHAFNPDGLSLEQAAALVVQTWGDRIPKFHMSSEDDQTRHCHDDYVNIHDYIAFGKAIQATGIPVACVMLEAKQKDKAILDLRIKVKR